MLTHGVWGTLPAPAGAHDLAAHGVNAQGQIVGIWRDSRNHLHGFLSGG